MQISQKLDISSQGLIKGGEASYAVELSTGNCRYQGVISVGALFFTKSYPFSGIYRINPDLLKSDLRKKDETFTVGKLTATIMDINEDHVASCIVHIKDIGAGTATFDLSGEFVKIMFLEITGNVKGFAVTLRAQATE